MSDTKNQLASFHEEVMHDADYTLAEAVAEARAMGLEAELVPLDPADMQSTAMPQRLPH